MTAERSIASSTLSHVWMALASAALRTPSFSGCAGGESTLPRYLPGEFAPSRSCTDCGDAARRWRPEEALSLLCSCPTGTGSAVCTRPEH